MKKFLLFLLGILCSVVTFAQQTYTTYVDDSGKVTQTATDGNTSYFTYAGDNPSSKYSGTYNNVTYSYAFKLNSAGSITFTTTASSSTVTIVESLSENGSSYVVAWDGTNLTGRKDDTTNNVGEFTLTGVEKGTHVISRIGCPIC